jgi:hypothetical protein
MNSLTSIIDAHNELRDHIAEIVHRENEHQIDPIYAGVLVQSFVFCFNTYKSLGLIIPEYYYEQACGLFRVLWEATLNLAWVTRDPLPRAKLYCQFTVVEKRKFFLLKVGDAKRRRDSEVLKSAEKSLLEFDAAYGHVIEDYRFEDRKGKKKIRSRFSGPTIEQTANELGGEWEKEYREVYPLLSFYTHATPGAILFPDVPSGPLTIESFQEAGSARTQMVALWSMAVLERSYRFMWPLLGLDDREYLDALDERILFRSSLPS